MALKSDHISVCICTYKRPKLLAKLLAELPNQITDQLFDYSIVVVDNDHEKSAKITVKSFKKNSSIDIDYYNEPEKNIALARNKSVENAKGNFIAFIDDDEFPVNDWLLNLYKAIQKYKADGVLGPVIPHFEDDPPQWIVHGKFCERVFFPTGTVFSNSKWTRTGNVLLNSNIFMNNQNMFDPKFGTGSEDSSFFGNLIEKGHTFVSCKEAPVYESVTSERLKKTYFLRRALLEGSISSKYKRNSFTESISIYIKTILGFFVYTLSLPFLYLLREHLFMKIFIKDCHHIGRLLAFMGINIIKERNF